MLNKSVLISSSHESARVNNAMLQTNIDLIANTMQSNTSDLLEDLYSGSALTITERIYLIQSLLTDMIDTRKSSNAAIANQPILQLAGTEYLAILDRADQAWWDLQTLIDTLLVNSDNQSQSIIDLATAIKQVYQL